MTSSKLHLALVKAINNAALSRRTALQIELAVGLINFSQEIGGTDSEGKAKLVGIYNEAGYNCLTKEDRDYKTVNRRMNVSAKLFDKLGSSVIHSWLENISDAKSMLQSVVAELQIYKFNSLDDVADFVGASSNRKKQAAAAKVETIQAKTETIEEPKAVNEVVIVESTSMDLDELKTELLSTLNDDEIREFCAQLLLAVVQREEEAIQKAA